MTGFYVKSLTKKGENALDLCIQEETVELQKRSLLERMKFNKIWVRKATRNPLAYWCSIHEDAQRMLLRANPTLIKECIGQVKIAMKKNGAELGIDFYVEEM